MNVKRIACSRAWSVGGAPGGAVGLTPQDSPPDVLAGLFTPCESRLIEITCLLSPNVHFTLRADVQI